MMGNDMKEGIYQMGKEMNEGIVFDQIYGEGQYFGGECY